MRLGTVRSDVLLKRLHLAAHGRHAVDGGARLVPRAGLQPHARPMGQHDLPLSQRTDAIGNSMPTNMPGKKTGWLCRLGMIWWSALRSAVRPDRAAFDGDAIENHFLEQPRPLGVDQPDLRPFAEHRFRLPTSRTEEFCLQPCGIARRNRAAIGDFQRLSLRECPRRARRRRTAGNLAVVQHKGGRLQGDSERAAPGHESPTCRS